MRWETAVIPESGVRYRTTAFRQPTASAVSCKISPKVEFTKSDDYGKKFLLYKQREIYFANPKLKECF